MSKDSIEIGKLIEDETERRLEIMQSPDYEWPQKAGKWNYIAVIALIGICGLLILLCMIGVIS